MSASVLFEIRADAVSDLETLLKEIDALPYAERQLMMGRLMVFRGQQMIEKAAGILALTAQDKARTDKARSSRAAKKASAPLG